jgi:serine/threonine protein kinase
MHDPTPPDVPDFDMLRPIGSGGYGQVWLATNRTTGHLRAVKVIPLDQPGRANPAAREISSLSRLEANFRCRHPNLLQIHHVGKTATHLFYVMDPADDISGRPASDDPEYQPATLDSLLQRREDGRCGGCTAEPANSCTATPANSCISARAERGCSSTATPTHDCHPITGPDSLLQPEVCLDYARQLLAGLASLHAAGMVHRDVKPANCLLVGGQLKLADFGLLTEAHPLVSRVGTRKYMPPDGRMDRRADVYAAGLVIYEMFTGLPVDNFPHLGRQARQVGRNPCLLHLLRVVLRACERDPELRFADARAMLSELEAPAVAAPRRRRRRYLAAVCAAVALAALGWGVWMLFGSDVEVSFVTFPYEAKIYVDDTLLVDADETPYLTPCTVASLSSGRHHLAFECKGVPRWDAGEYDFSETQQIVSRRPE